MIGLPDLIGRTIDIEQPPGEHKGEGMRCVLWAVHVHEGGTIEAEGTEGYCWRFNDETMVTLIDPNYDHDEMLWREGVRP